MTGLLTSLAARFSAETTAPIQPRPVYRFEGDLSGDGFDEIATDAVAVPLSTPVPKVMQHTPLAADAQTFATPSGPTPAPSSTVGTQQSVDPVLSEDPVRPDDPSPQALHEDPSKEPAPAPTRAPEEVRLTPDPLQERVIETTQVIETARMDQPAAPVPEQPVAAAHANPQTSEMVNEPFDARVEPALSEPPAADVPPAPVIKIGRIEVRSPAPPAPAPAPPRPQAKSPPAARPAAPTSATPARSGLTEYLGWRR